MSGFTNKDRKLKCIVHLAIAAIAFPILAAVGCTKQDPNRVPVFPATGKIVFQGKVPEGAFVVLHPKGVKESREEKILCPHAYVGPDGTFALTSYDSKDGAPAGEYALTVEWHKLTKFPSGDQAPGPNVLPREYSKATTSPMIVKIAEGSNELPAIVLK